MNHTLDNSTRPSPRLLWLQRAVLALVAVVMLGAMGYAARGTLADLRLDSRAPFLGARGHHVVDADNEYIAVRVRDSSMGDRPNGYELRLGVAYDNRIVYWRAPVEPEKTELTRGSTIMTSRGAGEILVAVGPIPHSSLGPGASGMDATVVEIDGQPFAVVHREAVANLIHGNARQKKSVTFHDDRLGVQGAIDLKHVG